MDNLAKHAEEAIGAGAANAADKKGTFAVKVGPPPPLYTATPHTCAPRGYVDLPSD